MVALRALGCECRSSRALAPFLRARKGRGKVRSGRGSGGIEIYLLVRPRGFDMRGRKGCGHKCEQRSGG